MAESTMRPELLDWQMCCDKSGPRYVKDHTGRHFCCHKEEWLDNPELEGCTDRPVRPDDLVQLILHGLCGAGTYHHLHEAGLVDSRAASAWNVMERMRRTIEELESRHGSENSISGGEFNLDDFDLDSLPDVDSEDGETVQSAEGDTSVIPEPLDTGTQIA